eukprot:11152524-Ditylum_brightwellii.AAC.1
MLSVVTETYALTPEVDIITDDALNGQEQAMVPDTDNLISPELIPVLAPTFDPFHHPAGYP